MGTKELKTQEKQQEKKKLTSPTHNSLQHDPKISMPLLSILVEALKKNSFIQKIGVAPKAQNSLDKPIESVAGGRPIRGSSSNENCIKNFEGATSERSEFLDEAKKNEDDKSLEGIAETEESIEQEGTEEEKKKKWKDPIVALAERIKQFYANEMLQQAYQAERNYHANAQYNNGRTAEMQTMMKVAYDQEEYGLTASEKQKLPKALTDENSIGYKLSKGDKYQTFIMTDPRGRLHSTWEIVRIMNESNEGTLERNDGLHYQGLS